MSSQKMTFFGQVRALGTDFVSFLSVLLLSFSFSLFTTSVKIEHLSLTDKFVRVVKKILKNSEQRLYFITRIKSNVENGWNI